MRKVEENRKCPRSKVNWPVTVTTSRKTIRGETRDVSPSGAFISCDRQMPPNQTFFISIHIHSNTISLSSIAETVWLTHNGMGVKFLYDNPEQGHLLAKFILDVCRPEDSLLKAN